MPQPKQPCRKCVHYQRKNTRGPKTYGTCTLKRCGRSKITHANSSGCKFWKAR